MISQEKQEALKRRLEKLGVEEKDLIEKFVLGSGPGGQKVNKSSTCVYLKHIASGTEIKCQKGRSLTLNRYYARQLLCEKLEKQLFDIKSAKEQELAKIRKQKRRRSRRTKEKMVEEKRQLSEKKQFRKSPNAIAD